MNASERVDWILQEGRNAWPQVVLARASALRFDGGGDDRPPEHPSEVFLAWACAAGCRPALRILDDEYLAPVARRLAASAALDIPEFMHDLRSRLLVAPDDAVPRLAGFRGTSRLSAWLRVVATRLASNHRRSLARRPEGGSIGDLPDHAWDPELTLVRQQARVEFRRAVERAVRRLDPEQRRLLRRHYLENTTLRGLAILEGRHRATIARRLARARQQLLADTRRELCERARVVPELSNRLHALGSLSWSRLLRSHPESTFDDDPLESPVPAAEDVLVEADRMPR